MRPTEYKKLKKIDQGHITTDSRYVTEAIRSHRRPTTETPLIAQPDDDPAERGSTTKPC